MKVIIINGTVKQGCTYRIKEMLLHEIGDGHEITEWYLPKDMPHFCTACFTCYEKGFESCPHAVQIVPIWDSIMSADLVVFNTPSYVFHAPAQVKALLDHLFMNWMPHRPKREMFFKQALIIANAAGAGMKSTIKDIKHSLSFWGISKIYSIKFALFDSVWNDVSEKRKRKLKISLKKIMNKILNRSSNIKVSVKTKLLFNVMKIAQKMINKNRKEKTGDYIYWQEQGWLGKNRPWKNNERDVKEAVTK